MSRYSIDVYTSAISNDQVSVTVTWITKRKDQHWILNAYDILRLKVNIYNNEENWVLSKA